MTDLIACATCAQCGKAMPTADMFSIFEFKCCSLTCLTPLREKRQAELDAEKAKRDANKPKIGTFSLSSGGNAAY